MGFNSLQVCMDSSDWLQSSMHEESAMDSSSPSGDMLMCSRPLIERRLRPHHDQPLKCPRCDSTHTKFCYYNNYSLSQPRYFCKTCRRYWTKGGTLRNIPVGGGCRKNKKVSTKKSNENEPLVTQYHHGSSSHNPANVHLSFSSLNNLLANPSFVEMKMINGGGNSYRNYDFLGNAEMGMMGGVGFGDVSVQNENLSQNSHGFCLPHAISIDGNGSNGGAHFVDECQRLLLPYHDHEVNDNQNSGIEVKPNAKILALDWQEQGCSDSGKENFSYINGFGSTWNTIVNGYGSSAPYPLV